MNSKILILNIYSPPEASLVESVMVTSLSVMSVPLHDSVAHMLAIPTFSSKLRADCKSIVPAIRRSEGHSEKTSQTFPSNYRILVLDLQDKVSNYRRHH